MSNAVNQEIDQKLQDFYQIRTGALLSDDSSLKMELLANLLYLYDATWSLEQEGARVVVGHAYHVMQQLPEDMKKPAIVRKIRKWLTLSELGHLLGEGPNIVESRKFGRLVTGLMDKLEQKLGRDGLRTRVRTVASQAAKVRGKENLRASCDGAGGSKTVSSPLLTAAAADNVQAPSPGRKKWGPPRSPNDLIPKIGKQIPRTPEREGVGSVSVSSVSSEEASPDLHRPRRPDRPKITMSDFDSPAVAQGGMFQSRDMLARTPLCPQTTAASASSPSPPTAPATPADPACPDLSLPPPPAELLQSLSPSPAGSHRPSGIYQLPQQMEEGSREVEDLAEKERERVVAQLREAEEVWRKKEEETEVKMKKAEMDLKMKKVELVKLVKEKNKIEKDNQKLSEKSINLKTELEGSKKKLEEKDSEIQLLKEKNQKLSEDLKSCKMSEKMLEEKNLQLMENLKEKESVLEDTRKELEKKNESEAREKIRENTVTKPIERKKVKTPENIVKKVPSNSKKAEATNVLTDEEDVVVQESSISSSDKLSNYSKVVTDQGISKGKNDNKMKATSTDTQSIPKSKTDEKESSSESEKRKQLLKEAMRANVEKRRQSNKNVLQKAEQAKEEARVRREKFEEDQQRKRRESLKPNSATAGAAEKPYSIDRKTAEKIETIEEVDNAATPVPKISPAKKIKLADRIVLSSQVSRRVEVEPSKPVTVATASDGDDESPPFYPLPDRKVQEPEVPKEDISPVTTKSKPVKTRKRKNTVDEPTQPSQPTEVHQAEVNPSPVKKGKRNLKKTKTEDPEEVKSVEKEKKSSNKSFEVSEEKKKPRGRKPKAPEKAEEKSEDEIEAKAAVEATEVVARPRRNCKKKFDSLADLASSSNPNSPAVVEVKKRGRPKTIVKPVEVEPPTPEEPREAPEAPEAPEVTAETLTKAAPSKRGRKPGKKAETAGTGSGSAEQAGAVIPTDLVSEEGVSSPKPEQKPVAKRGRPKKVKN